MHTNGCWFPWSNNQTVMVVTQRSSLEEAQGWLLQMKCHVTREGLPVLLWKRMNQEVTAIVHFEDFPIQKEVYFIHRKILGFSILLGGGNALYIQETFPKCWTVSHLPIMMIMPDLPWATSTNICYWWFTKTIPQRNWRKQDTERMERMMGQVYQPQVLEFITYKMHFQILFKGVNCIWWMNVR